MRVDCKGKHRTIFLTAKLCRALGNYCRRQKRTSGPVFVTRTGRPVDRSNIWREMRALSTQAGVGERKVFPHNFRHLFARAFYSLEKDMAKLADLLGHASVETTRIYIMESGAEHKRQVERLGLVNLQQNSDFVVAFEKLFPKKRVLSGEKTIFLHILA